MEFATSIPMVISRPLVAFCKRRSGFASLKSVLELGGGDPDLVVSYIENMLDFPRELGRQIARAKASVVAVLEAPEGDLFRVFRPTRSLLLVLAYWGAHGEPEDACDTSMVVLAEEALTELTFTLDEIQNESFALALGEICANLAIMEENGVDSQVIGSFRNRMLALCEHYQIKHLLIGRRRDSPVLEALDSIIRICNIISSS
jgi:hypothetical protein